ncbi:unnamed protein product [Brassica oleracea var. botrytis]|uniref:Uncharacterized protein n=1 Tax=Brassica oleracea TaxID=3712 RepID=A0A3P6FNE5_BRAOL|nr:unnamed protein product [Brassica oleracea]
MASRIFLHLHGPQQCLPRVSQVSSLTRLSPGVYVVRTINLLLKGRHIEGERSWFLQKRFGFCVDICDFLHFGALHDCKSAMVFAAVWYLQSGHFKQNPPTLVLPF